MAAIARQSQPAIKHRPPNGVMAPNQRMPLRLNRYRLPEKRTIPAAKAQPAAVVQTLGQVLAAQAAPSNARA